jgi:hypothetical protein
MIVKKTWIVLVTGLLLTPMAAQSYTLLSPIERWDQPPAKVCVQSPGHVSISDSDQGTSATINALMGANSTQWSGMGWNVVTTVGQTVNAVSTATASDVNCYNRPWKLGDGQPSIAFNEMVKGACGGTCLAATFVTKDCSFTPCHITDADVLTRKNRADRYGGPYYSLSEPQCTSGKEWDIEAIMVHEVGHVLGLGHSSVSGATMYPSISSCNSSAATIETDDSNALVCLYVNGGVSCTP